MSDRSVYGSPQLRLPSGERTPGPTFKMPSGSDNFQNELLPFVLGHHAPFSLTMSTAEPAVVAVESVPVVAVAEEATAVPAVVVAEPVSTERIFTFDELKTLSTKKDLHMLIHGKGKPRPYFPAPTLDLSSHRCPLQSTPLPSFLTR